MAGTELSTKGSELFEDNSNDLEIQTMPLIELPKPQNAFASFQKRNYDCIDEGSDCSNHGEDEVLDLSIGNHQARKEHDKKLRLQHSKSDSRKILMPPKFTPTKEQKDFSSRLVSYDETGTDGVKVTEMDHEKKTMKSDQKEPSYIKVSDEMIDMDDKKVVKNATEQKQGPIKCLRRNWRSRKSIHPDSAKIEMSPKVSSSKERKDLACRLVSYEDTGAEGAKVFSKDHEKKLEGLLMKFNNEVMMMRSFDNAVESLALLAMARAPEGTFNHINDAKSIMTTELKKFYEDENPQNRRFLLYNHFRLACEITMPGSVDRFHCSLCNMDNNFTCYSYLHHYYKHHSICPRYFNCDIGSCDFGTRLPSEFKDHILAVHQEQVQFSELSNQPHIVDAFSDYVCLRDTNTTHLFLIPPGVPSARPTVTMKTANQKKKSQNLSSQNKSLRKGTIVGVQSKITKWTPDLELTVKPGGEQKPHWRSDCMLVSQCPSKQDETEENENSNGPKVVLPQYKYFDKRRSKKSSFQGKPAHKKLKQ